MASSRDGVDEDLRALDEHPKQLTVSVVIPVRNGAPVLRRCLDALAGAEPAPDELMVVADDCTDESCAVAEEFGARVIELPACVGPASARNIGARAVSGDVLFFVDADVAIHPDAIALISEAFNKDPELTALFGSYDDTPGEPNFLSQYKNLLHHYVHQTGREDASTFWAGCGAIRRDVFLELDGFDEGFHRPSIEDIELGYRLRRAGYRTLLCKTLQATHWKRWTPLSLLSSDFLDRALPWTMLIKRDRRILDDLNLSWNSRVSALLTWILVAALATGWAWGGAWLIAGLSAAALVWLNLPLYRFFRHKRGLRFALQAVPWHWLYYFYSGLAFAVGMVGLTREQPRAQRPKV